MALLNFKCAVLLRALLLMIAVSSFGCVLFSNPALAHEGHDHGEKPAEAGAAPSKRKRAYDSRGRHDSIRA